MGSAAAREASGRSASARRSAIVSPSIESATIATVPAANASSCALASALSGNARFDDFTLPPAAAPASPRFTSAASRSNVVIIASCSAAFSASLFSPSSATSSSALNCTSSPKTPPKAFFSASFDEESSIFSLIGAVSGTNERSAHGSVATRRRKRT